MPKIKAVPAIVAALMMSACSTAAPITHTKIVEIPSSKPYSFITWSPDDSTETKRQIRAHNRRHQAVINAEKAKR